MFQVFWTERGEHVQSSLFYKDVSTKLMLNFGHEVKENLHLFTIILYK